MFSMFYGRDVEGKQEQSFPHWAQQGMPMRPATHARDPSAQM